MVRDGTGFREPQLGIRLYASLLSQTVGETGYIYCVDSNGIAVVHPNEKVNGHNFSYRGFVQEQIKRKEGYLRI